MSLKVNRKIILIGIICTVLCAYFGLQIQISTSKGSHKVKEASQTLVESPNKYPAVGTISPYSIEQYFNFKTYKDKYVLPRTFDYPKNELKTLMNLGESCDLTQLKTYLKQSNWTYDYARWQMFQCGDSEYKSAKFSKLHPFGGSYAKKYLETIGTDQNEKSILKHISEFHLSEVFEMDISLPLDYEIAKIVGSDIWKQMAKKPQIVLLSKYILVPSENTDEHSYRVYDREKYLSYLKEIRFTNGLIPFWSSKRFNSKNDFYMSWGLQLLSILSCLGTVLYVLFINVMFRQFKKKSASEQKIVLQGLTHEIRTPMTAIKLSLEPFRSHYMDLTPDLQKSFLNLSTSVEKCSQVIHSSHDFLKALNMDKSLISPVKIESVERFIVDNFPFEENFQIIVVKDFSLNSDLQWLKISLGNLIENSFKHGFGTVSVTLDYKMGKKSISVSDEGNLKDVDLEEILTPFVSSNEQTGLGLGLTLVSNIAKSLEARLLIKSDPTTFTLEWRDSHA